MKTIDYDHLIFMTLIVLLAVFLLWDLQQGYRIKYLEKASKNCIEIDGMTATLIQKILSKNNVIIKSKQDRFLIFYCSCGNHIYCQDYEDKFWLVCRNCGQIYTNTDCRTLTEYYQRMVVLQNEQSIDLMNKSSD